MGCARGGDARAGRGGGTAHAGELLARHGLRDGDGRRCGRKGVGDLGGTGDLRGRGAKCGVECGIRHRHGAGGGRGRGGGDGRRGGRGLAGRAFEIGALLLVQTGEGGGVDVLGEHGELTRLERRIDHEADERGAHEAVALLLGLGAHELGDLAGELGVIGRQELIVIRGDEHGVEGGGGVDAVDDQGLVLHLAGRLLGELLKGEGRLRRAEDPSDAVFKYVQEVHERSPSEKSRL